MLPSAALAAAAGDGDAPIRLRCLGGGVPSPDVVEGAARAGKLTAGAVKDLGPILRACTTSPMTPELGQALSRYCVAREIAEADLGHVIRAARFLLREASAANTSPEDLTADARTLFGEHEELVGVIGAEYEAIRGVLRRELVVDALLKHGNVLDDVDWRIDVVATDRHAPRLGVPVALVTLALRSAAGAERVSLQLTTEQLERLQNIFGALAQKARLIGQ